MRSPVGSPRSEGRDPRPREARRSHPDQAGLRHRHHPPHQPARPPQRLLLQVGQRHALHRQVVRRRGRQHLVRADGAHLGRRHRVGRTADARATGQEVHQRQVQYCGASQKTLDRGEGLETHAYAFIHTDDIKARIAELFGDDMQFDVIIGNPPYQLDDGGFGTQRDADLPAFVEQAKTLDPRFAVDGHPVALVRGRQGLDEFRERMLTDKRLREYRRLPERSRRLPGVESTAASATSSGTATTTGLRGHDASGRASRRRPASRPLLDEFDIFVRRNEAVPILAKVVASKRASTIARALASRAGQPFGLPTHLPGQAEPRASASRSSSIGSAEGSRWVARVADHDERRLGRQVEGASSTAASRTATSDSESRPGSSARRSSASRAPPVPRPISLHRSLRRRSTRRRTHRQLPAHPFVRFLVSSAQDHPGHHAQTSSPSCRTCRLDRAWTDEKLYARYGITDDEIAFIEYR